VKKGVTAPQAAGVIHSDFQKHFICAEQMRFDDFKEHGNEAEVKKAGKYKTMVSGQPHTIAAWCDNS
jgi:ribosome-binding ATPase YchF (GTP1/OBG family)